MTDYRNRSTIGGVTLVAALVTGGIWLWQSEDQPPSEPSDLANVEKIHPAPPLPVLTASPYLNTTAKAVYVGTAACAECHEEAHQTYLETPHSQALADVVLANEPPPGEFHHEKSGRTYRVYHKDGKMWHRELLSINDGEDDILLGDFPIAYTIGSGSFTRSYLVAIDGFFVESPVTWYVSRKAWGVSPGYDTPNHFGFTRPVGVLCLFCHSGRVEPIDGSEQRVQLHEMSIGCENCHGPGSLHVKLRKEHPEPVKGIDFTIVNPSHLSRELGEAICAYCHLQEASSGWVRGRGPQDFRPGLPLTDFRVDYRFDVSNPSMTVTGHMGQMHLSKCYTESKTLTCTTCHDPHSRPAAATLVTHYRDKCLACHEGNHGCQLPENKRLQKSPEDDCIVCHMPQTDTDIEHVAFTHHRIGTNHKLQYEKSSLASAPLIPVVNPQLPNIDQQRALGLACLNAAGRGDGGDLSADGLRHLEKVYSAGLRDPTLMSALAWGLWQQESAECIDFARQALETADCPPTVRSNALTVLGRMTFHLGETQPAKDSFTKLVRHRRAASDWRMLAACRALGNDLPGAISALERAVEIRRDRADLHEMLSKLYQHAGRSLDAKKHHRLAERLDAWHQSRSDQAE